LQMLPALAKGLAAIAPTCYVTGNHEWSLGTGKVKELKSLLGQYGVTVLSNRYEFLERDGARIVLAGVDDPNGYADQKTPEELYAQIEAKAPGLFTLLLAHRNDRFGQYANAGYDFVLSGHGHGGIVRLPFVGGLVGTNRQLFPKWTSGLYTIGDSTLFVSRGLGNNTVPFPGLRVFNRPELAVLTLKSEG
ncbi:MAG: metallophosphoesterase, partial [Oscillospiraceae bacterium]|nr:metallophosphoesterase [Oscillospiraceae bacterium]